MISDLLFSPAGRREQNFPGALADTGARVGPRDEGSVPDQAVREAGPDVARAVEPGQATAQQKGQQQLDSRHPQSEVTGERVAR